MIKRLRVIMGGGKPTPSQKIPPKRGKWDRWSDELYKVLPAPDRRTIADRLEQRLGVPVTISNVDELLRWVRRHCDTLRWIPFYAARGKNVTGADRYIITLLDKDGTFHNDTEQLSMHDGSVTTLRALQTTSRRFHAMLLAEAGRLSGRKKPRMLRALAADLDYFASKVDDMIEEIEEENGTV
jgi:hypothetical protein